MTWNYGGVDRRQPQDQTTTDAWNAYQSANEAELVAAGLDGERIVIEIDGLWYISEPTQTGSPLPTWALVGAALTDLIIPEGWSGLE